MPQPWKHGHFYWNELMTRDVERAKRFYAETRGGKFDGMPMPDGTYWLAKSGDEIAASSISARRSSHRCRSRGWPTSPLTTSMPA